MEIQVLRITPEYLLTAVLVPMQLLELLLLDLERINQVWRWSLHAGPQMGKDSENHIGYVISARMMVKDPSGNEAEIESGCAFEIARGSDAWVIGDDPCIAIDFIPISDHSKSQ